MPRIKEYGESKVETNVAKGARAQSYHVASIGDLASGVQAVGGALKELQDRNDKTAAEEALVSFEREKNNLFFNPESGYFNSKGRDAFESAKSVNDQMMDLKKRYSEKLSQRAKDVFSKAADVHITRGSADIMRHASNESRAWEVSVIRSRVENTLESSVLYWNDNDRLILENATGRQSIRDAAKLEGLDDAEILNERLQTYDSSFAKGVISAAINSSAEDGKKALDKYGSMLEGPDRVSIDKLVVQKEKEEKVQNDARFSVTMASSLVSKYDSKIDAIADPTVEALKESDPQLYKQVRSEIVAQFSAAEVKKAAEEKDAYYRVIGMVNDKHTIAEMQQSSDWLKMNDMQRNNILSGKHIVSDYVLMNNLLGLPTKDLAAVDPNKYTADLNKTDLNKLANAVDKAKKGGPMTRTESLSHKTKRVAQELFGAESNWRKKRGGLTPRGELANGFMGELQNTINQFEEDNDRKITPEEEDKIIANMSRDFHVQRSRGGFDFLAADINLNVRNTPVQHLTMLNKIADTFSLSAEDRIKLAESYEVLIEAGADVNPTNLQKVFDRR